jgi:hypothetical protein
VAVAISEVPNSLVEYLALPMHARAQHATPLVTLRWVDSSEVAHLSSQSWFAKLRQDLNGSGKVTFTLGVFKYEQGGRQEAQTERELWSIARRAFEKATPLTGAQLAAQLEKATSQGVFEPSLVMLEGDYFPAFSGIQLVRRMLAHASAVAGLDVREATSNVTGIDSSKLVDVWLPIATQLFSISGADIPKAYSEWSADSGNLEKLNFQGSSLARAELRMPDNACNTFSIGVPAQALTHLPPSYAFGARVLGWIEHNVANSFFLRTVAIASVALYAPNPAKQPA